jgi:hypothetical protein
MARGTSPAKSHAMPKSMTTMGTKENYEANKRAAATKADKKKLWFRQREPIDRFTGWLVAWTALLFAATVISAGILWKTDQTLRAGQRAFVFVKFSDSHWSQGWTVGNDTLREYYIEWENNGNSQTKDLKVSLFCPRPNAFDKEDPITSNKTPAVATPRLLGPKQSVWGGVCYYLASELESIKAQRLPMFVAARATYRDIFDESHITEYCVQITDLDGDFKTVGGRITNYSHGCAAPNCADEECRK